MDNIDKILYASCLLVGWIWGYAYRWNKASKVRADAYKKLEKYKDASTDIKQKYRGMIEAIEQAWW